MSVVRIETDQGSHIEPPCPQDASDLDRLLWMADVVECDTQGAISLRVTQTDGGYALGAGGWSLSALPFHETWVYMNAMITGYELANKRRNPWG